MIKEKLAEGIYVYKNVMPDSLEIIKRIERDVEAGITNWTPSAIRADKGSDVNKMVRDTDIIGIPYCGGIVNEYSNIHDRFYKEMNNHFYEAFNPCEEDYKSEYGLTTEWHDTWSLLKYNEGQFFTNHVDDDIVYHRRVSTTYYMNDDYTGGEINFPRWGLSIKPEKHDLLIFPSIYTYNHSVSPVLSGTRYAVVGWLK